MRKEMKNINDNKNNILYNIHEENDTRIDGLPIDLFLHDQ